MRRKHRQKGFTLIEVIAVLILVGIMAAFAGMGIVAGVQGYLFSKDNAAISEKAQLTIARINRELLECYTCSGTSGSAVAIPFTNTLGQRYIRLNSGNIELSPDGANYDTLMGQVGNGTFSMIYNADNKSVTVRFQSSQQPGGVSVPEFVTTVTPRNTP